MRVNAEVAELVDALASGASVRKNVGVRISLSAQCRKEVSAQGGQVLSGTLKKFAQKLEAMAYNLANQLYEVFIH